MNEPSELNLSNTEVFLWEQGHPVHAQAWVCDTRTGTIVRTFSPARMKELSDAGLLEPLGTPAEAGLKVQTAYQSFVYRLKGSQ